MMKQIGALVLTSLALSVGCSKPVKQDPAPSPSAQAQAASAAPQASASASALAATANVAAAVHEPIPPESMKVFEERCSLCHGKGGKGDGVGGKGMKPPPRNWTDPEWQASVDDAHIAQTLLKGGAAVGKSPTMPPSPDLESQPKTVAGLVQLVRSFRGK